MKTIPSLIPGSPAWLQSRSASKAPAVMGASKYQTRSDLLKQMATGIKEDVDAATQERFDAGHASEAAAREIAEDILCDGLSPVCGESDDGYLTASFDGLTFDGRIGYEHKLWNETLAAAVRADELPEEYKWQMDQQILVGGLDYVLFMVSDGTREKMVSMEYRSTNERALALLAGWRQFDIDLAAYQHVEAAPVATAAPINELPALMVEITGSVTASNLVQWKEIVTERIAGINTDLQTDTDFANADAMVKFLDDGEKRIDLVKSQAQANAADIDRVFRALDEIKASMRAKRLELDKLVTKRKESIKVEIVQEGKTALAAHMNGLNKRLVTVQMPPIAADFAAAIKGKRNLASMRDAVSTLLAQKKIEANEIADLIQINIGSLDETGDYAFLFADRSALCLKAPDDLALVIKTRIADRKAEEAKREAEQRERIRAEEEARAAAKVKADQEAEDALIAGFWANARRIEFDSVPYIQKAINAFECMAPDWENDPRPRVAAAVADARKEMQDKLAVAKAKAEQEARDKIAAENLAAEKEFSARIATEAEASRGKRTEPAPLPAPAESNGGRLDETAGGAAQPGKPVITIDGPFTSDIQIQKLDDGARIRLGEISDRLGFTVTADFISSLGFHPVETVKAAKMYRESDFIPIVSSLIDRLDRVRAKDWRAAA